MLSEVFLKRLVSREETTVPHVGKGLQERLGETGGEDRQQQTGHRQTAGAGRCVRGNLELRGQGVQQGAGGW